MIDIALQVCSLELSKVLKELGIKQESYFVWAKNNLIPRLAIHGLDKHEFFEPLLYAAFTSTELGVLLPISVNYLKRLKSFVAQFRVMNKIRHEVSASIEADSRAKMLIYLIKNNKISIDEINNIITTNGVV